MTSRFTESIVEEAALAWLEEMGYQVLSGLEIAPGEIGAERDDYGEVVLARRLRQALLRLNPGVPHGALEEAFRKLTRPDSPSLVVKNHIVHKYLVDGVPVEYQRADGRSGRPGPCARLRRTGEQRVPGGEPVHRGRGQTRAPAGRGAVRQRPAAGGDRTEERR